ncbi:MAG: hypothetical protein M1837_004133 [Sclerophora amabilis]|nr:MAG: hypothetical protein M1837_004133 [Sclerophora amabilis]
MAVPDPMSTSSLYYLKTKVWEGGNESLDNLYCTSSELSQPSILTRLTTASSVQSYHTGAGTSDATLGRNKSVSLQGRINDTHQEFPIPESSFPYGLSIEKRIQSTGWCPVSIDAGLGEAGFSLEDGISLTSNSTYFAGWLACNWWLGVPQLFWKLSFYHYEIPGSCANVTLLTELV